MQTGLGITMVNNVPGGGSQPPVLRAERPISQTNPELPQVGKQTEATQPLVPVLISKGCNDLKPNAMSPVRKTGKWGITLSPKFLPVGLSPMSTERRRHPLLSRGLPPPQGSFWWKTAGVGGSRGLGNLGRHSWPPACESAMERPLSHKGAEEQSSIVHAVQGKASRDKEL